MRERFGKYPVDEEEAQAEMDSYFEIVDWLDKRRDTWKEDL